MDANDHDIQEGEESDMEVVEETSFMGVAQALDSIYFFNMVLMIVHNHSKILSWNVREAANVEFFRNCKQYIDIHHPNIFVEEKGEQIQRNLEDLSCFWGLMDIPSLKFKVILVVQQLGRRLAMLLLMFLLKIPVHSPLSLLLW